SFTVVGTGFFKPNISTMVGSLYGKNDNRRDAGFSLFYSGINIGALLGGYACIAIGKGELFAHLIPNHLYWNVAFGLAAIVMTISLITFAFTQKTLGPIGLSPFKSTTIDEKGETVTVYKSKNWYNLAVFAGSLATIPIIMTMVAKTEYTDYFMYIIG